MKNIIQIYFTEHSAILSENYLNRVLIQGYSESRLSSVIYDLDIALSAMDFACSKLSIIQTD